MYRFPFAQTNYYDAPYPTYSTCLTIAFSRVWWGLRHDEELQQQLESKRSNPWSHGTGNFFFRWVASSRVLRWIIYFILCLLSVDVCVVIAIWTSDDRIRPSGGGTRSIGPQSRRRYYTTIKIMVLNTNEIHLIRTSPSACHRLHGLMHGYALAFRVGQSRT